MKVELSEQDLINTIGFLNRAPLKGEESLTMAVLLQMYRTALQPQDGARPAEEIPAEEPAE